VAAMTAYFDESGTHKGSPVIIVAGCLSTNEQWAKFSEEWRAVLKRYGLDYFRMSQFENRKGPFKSLTDSDRHRLLEQLIGFIKIRQRIGIGIKLKVADYYEVGRDFPFLFHKQPYAFCAMQCQIQLRLWAERNQHNEPIAYVYESGADYTGQILSAYDFARKIAPQLGDALRLGSLSFGSKYDLLPLQAADVLAYETYKDVSNWLAGSPRPLRWPLMKLDEAPLFST
jgi:uncharacterized protein DUF3800